MFAVDPYYGLMGIRSLALKSTNPRSKSIKFRKKSLSVRPYKACNKDGIIIVFSLFHFVATEILRL